MNKVKYCSLGFLLVLSNLLYSENKLVINTADYFEKNISNISSSKGGISCSRESAESIIRALPEVAEAQTHIQSLTNNEKGISIMSDSTSIEGNSYHTFQVGFDGPDRFETYYFLFVNKTNCSDIKIVDIISGDVKPINEWRKTVL